MAKTNGYATRDDLLASGKRRHADVDVSGYGRFRIQSITAGELAKIEAASYTEAKEDRAAAVASWQARYICTCLVDGDGNRLFSDDELAHVQRMDSRLTSRLYEAIAKHTGTSDEGTEGN